MSKIVLTGIQSSGVPHIGNYIGALKPLIEKSADNKTYMFIADLHSLNSTRDGKIVSERTYEIAALMIVMGLNLDNAILFRQSDVPYVSELSTFLMNITPKGLMNRAHSYKAAMDRNIALGEDVDAGINMGLYTYPVLMAADILLYNTDIVPVGRDQKQHVEFTRDIAEYFNKTYGKIFKLPTPVIDEDTGILPGLDGRKMSKSYGNGIALFASESELKKKIGQIITDSKTPEEPKNADESTIFKMYSAFANADEVAEMRAKFENGGFGYGALKQILFEKINSVLAPRRAEYERLMANRDEIDAVLERGANAARDVARETVSRVRKLMLGQE